ncbi:MAG: hypothetical protein IMZ61_09750 [Planctomycetes bacterium]|nr:hypothetical protein [Planctomycetota bacterium]
MTPEELADKLKDCQSQDTENCHMAADRLLLEYINNDEVTKAFYALSKWYA